MKLKTLEKVKQFAMGMEGSKMRRVFDSERINKELSPLLTEIHDRKTFWRIYDFQ